MNYLLLAVSIFLATAKSAVYNLYAKSAEPDTGGVFRFNALTYGTAAVLALLFALLGDGLSFSRPTLLCAVLYGITVCALQTFSIITMRIGPMSLTALIVSYGMIIPALAGPIFWHESFGALQIAGLSLIIVSLWLIRDKDGAKKSVTLRWMLLLIACFLLSGTAGLIEKIHQSTSGRDEKAAFVLVGCCVMLAVSLLAALLTAKKTKRAVSLKKLSLSGSAAGLTVGLYSIVNLTLAGELNSLIYYPIANGGFLLLAMLASIVLFREKLTRLKSAGFLVGLCAIILLSLPV